MKILFGIAAIALLIIGLVGIGFSVDGIIDLPYHPGPIALLGLSCISMCAAGVLFQRKCLKRPTDVVVGKPGMSSVAHKETD